MVKKVVEKPEQSTLSKAVKNVKQKLLTTKENQPEIKIPTETPAPEFDYVKLNRGVVYLGHIPHGFFEEQMRDYFKQFGKVTRVRLVRSKKTGRSRGYGYVEFLHSEVAQIAAESMNNYLMCGRLLKATYIPPEKQHSGFFIGRQWSKQKYPQVINRKEQNTQKNKNVDNKVEAALVARGLSKISNIEKKLAAVGIVYSINPVEVPPPAVKKRKAIAQLPPAELKKRKIASGDSDEKKEKKEKTAKIKKIEKTAKIVNLGKLEKKESKQKKELKVAEPLVQTIKTKNAKNEVLPMKTKKSKKIGSLVKSIEKERSKIKKTRVLRHK